MNNDHLEERIAVAKMFDDEKQYVDPVLEETKRLVKEHRKERQTKIIKSSHITVGQAQEIIKKFFCECIKNDIMEVDVIDANAELCRRIEAAAAYTESRGKNGKKIDG